MQRIAALVGGVLLLAAADACPTCIGPTWSWDRFPAFFHSSQHDGPGGGFSPAAIATIARFPMATLEKWQGDQVTPPISEEQAWVVAAKQIKAANPKIAIAVWLDSFRIYTADKSLNPDLIRPCSTGHFAPADFLERHPEYLLKNASGQPALCAAPRLPLPHCPTHALSASRLTCERAQGELRPLPHLRPLQANSARLLEGDVPQHDTLRRHRRLRRRRFLADRRRPGAGVGPDRGDR